MSPHIILKLRVVGRESAQANRAHLVCSSASWSRHVEPIGNKIQQRLQGDRKAKPSAKRLSPVIVLMPISRPSESYNPPPLLPGLIAAVVCRIRTV